MLRRRGYWIFRRFSGLGIGFFMLRRRGCRILAFLDKDLDYIGEEAIGFYGFSSFPRQRYDLYIRISGLVFPGKVS